MNAEEKSRDKGEEVLEFEEEVIEEEGLKEKFKKLKSELELCRKDKEGYLAGWQRAKADFINARKDEEKARQNFLKFAEENLLRDFLSVADSLELALKLKPAEGMKEIYSELRELLKQHGVSAMEAEAKKFSPSEHEAIEKMEVSDSGQDGMVLEELQKGWYLYDKVLRPAKVKVGVYKIKS
jgi:molecular chaperone GrpE